MKTILSIDPALKNIAMTTIKFDDEGNIIDIEPRLIDIMQTKTITYNKMMKNLMNELDEINIDDVDYIIIENQPSLLNMRVKSVAVAIHTYFLLKKKEVCFVSPSLKLSKEENKLKYAERKKLSIIKTLNLLNDEMKAKISKYKKADDISDSIIMAKSWFDKLK